ncbi:uncharacterized protein LOC126796492 [Argentina anserina]|uniref:uncharacterized protein LOC126796492 n=1 Tax=Argentina anserina TaxID=57926 RepID=UPI002176257B|nr:uncharacterized protein LOC126796492 [Potentilla anserina]
MVREKTVASFYWRLRESAKASSGSPLLIFPSTSDVDSLCALKIILHVLESDSVGYSCYPVSSFQDIHKYAGLSEENPITILLINWGCHRDLRRLLGLSPLSRVFVVDSHRPIHLHNLSEQNESVVVLYTQEDELQGDLAYDFHDVSALANASDLNSDDELDGDSESGDGDGSRKKRRVSEEEEEQGPEKLFKRLKKKYYHLGSFHGKPSGCLMYDLAHSLRKNTNELLWLSCVSLTDQFVHHRLTDERYQAAVMELEQLIISSGTLEAVTSVTDRIAFEDVPRLMLLHEWNLFESMKCSSYSATKMKTWNDKGISRLIFLLARMGFALEDCQQKFSFMNVEVKRRMKAQFEQLLPEYGLTDFYYRSFLRIHGYGSRVYAADVVYGVTALLESFVESDGSCAAKQFGVAYDALSLNNLDKLKAGMQKAILVQRAIARQGSRAVTNIRTGTKFVSVKLEDSVDAKLLGYPQALTKFCYFLMDALKEKGARMKPLVCACLAQDPKKMIVVGVCGKPRVGAVKGNSFGLAFRSAAQEISAEFFHEMFESSWIILDSNSFDPFMKSLMLNCSRTSPGKMF